MFLIVGASLVFGLIMPITSYAGCRVKVMFKNQHPTDHINVLFGQSEVKTTWGKWSDLKDRCGKNKATVENDGEYESRICELRLGCAHKRNWNFYLRNNEDTDENHLYFIGGTTTTTIDLGDIGRFF